MANNEQIAAAIAKFRSGRQAFRAKVTAAAAAAYGADFVAGLTAAAAEETILLAQLSDDPAPAAQAPKPAQPAAPAQSSAPPAAPTDGKKS